MRIPTAISFLVLLTLEANAQTFTFYNYTIAEGLPSAEVYEVYQDKKGFLWFATDNGVAKFDGSQMKVFNTRDGLTDPVVFGFYEDSKNRIWFRTFSGQLCYYENGELIKYIYNDKLAALKTTWPLKFIITETDDLWFACRSEVGKIDSVGNLTSTREKMEGFYYKSIGQEFLISNDGLPSDQVTFIIDGKEFFVRLQEPIVRNRVLCALKWKNKTYFSVSREVFEYDGIKLRTVITAKYPVINIAFDHEENLWVGYMEGGAERFNLNDFSDSWKPDFLEKKSVTKIIQDHEGGLWFSTLENGVYHAPNLLIQHYQIPASSRIKGVLNVQGKVIAADRTGNIYELNTITKKASLVKSLQGPLLKLFDQDNKIIVSSGPAVYVYDHHFELKNKIIGQANDFTKGKNGSIWGFGNNKFIQLDKNNELTASYIVRTPYRALHLEDTLFFLADRTGLHIMNEKLEVLQIHKDFTDIKISDIKKINDSTLLIATIGKGFFLMNPRTLDFRMFNSQHNFIADHVFSSLIDDNYLWMGTEKGLFKLPVDQLHKLSVNFNYLTIRNGSTKDKIDFLIRSGNDIWAFSNSIFSTIPLSFTRFAKKPLFYIQEAKVNDRLVKLENIRDLEYLENNIQIAFGFISFSNQNIFVRYKLSINENWIYTINKQLFFTSLAPGKYSMELEYSIDNIQWVSAIKPLNFIIRGPWWTKWYVQVTAFLSLLALVFFYFRHQQSLYRRKNHYLKIINEHQQKLIQSEIVTLERERNRISKELHDRVGTNLSAIKLTVNQLLNQHKEPLATDIEEQFQLAVKEIKNIIYGLTPPGLERYGLFTGLKNYVGRLTRTIPISISLKTYGKESHNHELNIIVFRVLQELLTNTIKHAFAKNITIHISAFKDMLNVVYEDDGVGFSYGPLQSGLGLDNIESRIQSVNGTLKFESGDYGISYTIDIPILNKEVA